MPNSSTNKPMSQNETLRSGGFSLEMLGLEVSVRIKVAMPYRRISKTTQSKASTRSYENGAELDGNSV